MTCRAVRDDDINAGDFTGAEETRSESDRGDDAIFIHGFTSSSSFWAQTVFPEPAAANHRRLIAVDLLGFGDSPQPADCPDTPAEPVPGIERGSPPSGSLPPRQPLDGLHHRHRPGRQAPGAGQIGHARRPGTYAAHSIRALHHSEMCFLLNGSVASCWSQLYFLPCEERASQVALRRLAEKKLWPPLLFGSAVMSWYEHIGRTICFVVCKNHRFWEWLIKILTRTRLIQSSGMNRDKSYGNVTLKLMEDIMQKIELLTRYCNLVLLAYSFQGCPWAWDRLGTVARCTKWHLDGGLFEAPARGAPCRGRARPQDGGVREGGGAGPRAPGVLVGLREGRVCRLMDTGE
uniref:Uncharacterized protein n=1 Tax=Aegilops tauschii TaxID=37682 RepID=M8BH86_AEGTA